jgi:Fe-S-cluster containining protein
MAISASPMGLVLPVLNTVTPPRSCKGCGACCSGLFVELCETDNVPAKYTQPYDDARIMRQHKDTSCIAFDRKIRTCRIYKNRPVVCRDFDRGGNACLATLSDYKRRLRRPQAR